MKDQVSVAVTGLAWMGAGVGSIETAMERLFREAEHEILITSYSISSAADAVLDWMALSAGRGVVIRFAVNKFSEQPYDVRTRLNKLNASYPHFTLFTFDGSDNEDLHAKAIVADRKFAIVGSSNLSRRGLLTNHELALIVQGHQAEIIASALDRLFASQALTKIAP